MRGPDIPTAPLLPNPIIVGTTFRGYTVTVEGTQGNPVQFQEKTGAGSAWSNVALSSPLLLGGAQAGKALRAVVTAGGITYNSPAMGPVGLSDTISPENNAYLSIGTDVALINTAGAGYSGSYTKGVDFLETMVFYREDMGANALLTWDLGIGVGTYDGNVFCYEFFSRNRYNQASAASAYVAGVAHSELSTFAYTWELYETPGSDKNVTVLIEYFPSDDANDATEAVGGVGGHKKQELGLIPVVGDAARLYFNSAPNVVYPDYIDENGLTWLVRSKGPPGQVISTGNYTIAMPPVGVSRWIGSFRFDRYINWLISQDATKSAHYMTGIAAGLEILTKPSTGGQGSISGKFMPQFAWSALFASAYTFDADVASYYARFSNLPGIEVRKATDAFIAALKTATFYTKMDELYLLRGGGKLDMLRAFKTSTRDIITQVGTALYRPKQGLTYAGAGYGKIPFNPATAGGQFTQDSAHLFMFLDADLGGAVSAPHFGNAGAQFRRAGSGGLVSRLNDATDDFAGNYSYPQGWMIRRTPGAIPEGTGGSAAYQARRTGSTGTFRDAPVASQALVSADLEIGRAGSGSVYSQGVFSLLSIGWGPTLTEATLYHTLVMTYIDALNTAGV